MAHLNIARLSGNPIITPALDTRIGTNINGPSLIRVPDWVPNPMGRYYLYFAHHEGLFIRLAYADSLTGPWRVHIPGTLDLASTPCQGHIASPDVHVDHVDKRIVMYYHGPIDPQTPLPWRTLAGHSQCTFVAISRDGLNFTSATTPIGPSYLRAFQHEEWVYALCMPGLFVRSHDGLSDFEVGPRLFDDNMRHAAVKVIGHILHVFYTTVGDAPERILHAEIDLRPDWHTWQASEPVTVLAPELPYEGATLPISPSVRGVSHDPVHQLRDPAIFTEDGNDYLLYSIAGEQGIAIASLAFTE